MAHDGPSEEENAALLPTQQEHPLPTIPADEVTKVALRLKHQIETVIPVELDEDQVTRPLSLILNKKVIQTAREAGGRDHSDCVVYCLLVCKRWFYRQAKIELWDADLHNVRGVACEVIAKRIIESEDDTDRLLTRILLQRFSIITSLHPREVTAPTNVIERAVDLHALRVIGSSGYQKCVAYLWRGWLVQDDDQPTQFIFYKDRINPNYWAHLDPDRMRVPRYQNALQVIISLVYLGLYTGAINTINATGDLDFVEAMLYLFTLAFICAELAKVWKVGRYAIGFWNVFNMTLYALLVVSFVARMVALGHVKNHNNPHLDLRAVALDSMDPSDPLTVAARDERKRLNHLSYNFLAFTAPMFWMRMLLYIDSLPFFGAMLVVIKNMFAESLIFFALLFVVLVGFFQGFVGLDLVDESMDKTSFIITNLANAIMSSPDFDGFDNFAPPFGITLYYVFSFVVMVILLNILIALYNSSYEDVSSNATDEYMALFSNKCLQFVRAPDENVFIAPFNLIEIVFLVLPFEWCVSKRTYATLNNYVMGFIYAPLLVVTAALEQREARKIVWNRKRGEEDEDTVEEWEVLGWKPDGGNDGPTANSHSDGDKAWCDKVEETSPDPAKDAVLEEVKTLRQEIKASRGETSSASAPGKDAVLEEVKTLRQEVKASRADASPAPATDTVLEEVKSLREEVKASRAESTLDPVKDAVIKEVQSLREEVKASRADTSPAPTQDSVLEEVKTLREEVKASRADTSPAPGSDAVLDEVKTLREEVKASRAEKSPAPADDALLEEVKTLREEVKASREDLRQLKAHVERSTQQQQSRLRTTSLGSYYKE